jgi:RNA ligase (TIGR02306 family)
MSRALATLRVVRQIQEIPGADNIELAFVDDWQVVVKKGEFSLGDKACFFEIDSFLPVRPEYEFLRKSCYRKLVDRSEGFRLKTVRLRGQLSQGLLLPIRDVVKHLANPELVIGACQVGDDFTSLLDVTLWSPAIPVSIAGEMKGNFPTHLVPKTDEERIQNLTKDWEMFRSAKGWIGREKLDGTSITMFFDGENFGICSRNWELKDTPDHPAWKLAREHDVEARLRANGRPLALQGELIGPGIQGNKYKLVAPSWRLFSLYDIKNHVYLGDSALESIGTGLLEFDCCPVVYRQDELPETISDLLQKSEITTEVAPIPTLAEGIVWRHYSLGGIRKYSFKAISNMFLLAEKS